jgi:hypothetical protein
MLNPGPGFDADSVWAEMTKVDSSRNAGKRRCKLM